MLRPCAVASAFLVALMSSGCGKSEPAKPTPQPAHGGKGQVGTGTGAGTPTVNPDGTEPVKKPPVDVGSGWVPTKVPDDAKNLDYTGVFHIMKIKGNVFVENLERFVMKRSDDGGGTGSSMTAANLIDVKTEWEIVGAGIMEKMKTAPDKTDLYFRLKGKRTMTKKWGPPVGMVGEKQEWTFAVDSIVWEKSETQYFHETTILEEELWDDYLAAIEGDINVSVKLWRKHQDTAEDIGWGLSDRERDRTKKPFHNLVSAIESIAACQAQIDKKAGNLDEAVAWLNVILEWTHFPGVPVNGDVDTDERQKRAQSSLAGKIRLTENQFLDRLKSGGIVLAPSDASKLIAATDGTMAQKFSIYAAEAGQFELSAELSMAVFATKEKPEWKQTTLSLLKTAVTGNEKFFAAWPDEALIKFPGRLKDAVLPFTKGQLIPTRNALAVVEALRKAKPALACSPTIDEVIAELKKK
jgi:hypothetical protein